MGTCERPRPESAVVVAVVLGFESALGPTAGAEGVEGRLLGRLSPRGWKRPFLPAKYCWMRAEKVFWIWKVRAWDRGSQPLWFVVCGFAPWESRTSMVGMLPLQEARWMAEKPSLSWLSMSSGVKGIASSLRRCASSCCCRCSLSQADSSEEDDESESEDEREEERIRRRDGAAGDSNVISRSMLSAVLCLAANISAFCPKLLI